MATRPTARCHSTFSTHSTHLVTHTRHLARHTHPNAQPAPALPAHPLQGPPRPHQAGRVRHLRRTHPRQDPISRARLRRVRPPVARDTPRASSKPNATAETSSSPCNGCGTHTAASPSPAQTHYAATSKPAPAAKPDPDPAPTPGPSSATQPKPPLPPATPPTWSSPRSGGSTKTAPQPHTHPAHAPCAAGTPNAAGSRARLRKAPMRRRRA